MDEQFATHWEAVADAVPDQPALVQGERRVSWGELDDRAARLAAALRDLGLGAGSKVAFDLYNGNEYLELAYAVFKLRAVHVNVNYRYLEDELAFLLENSDAEVLVFHGSLAPQVDRVRGRIPALRALVQVDDGSPHLEGALRYEDLVAQHDPMERIPRSGDDLYFLYTGGTTGMPKAVMWRHEDLYAATMPAAYMLRGMTTPDSPAGAAEAARQLVERANAPVHLPASPLMHGTGFFTTLQALTGGGTVVTLEERHFDAHELWRAVQRERVNTIAIVGDAFGKPMVRALEEAEDRGEPYDLSSVQIVVSSGVMWTPPVKQALLDRGQMLLFDSLGASEGVGFGASITAPGSDVGATARFSVGEHATVITEDGRFVEPGSGEVGMLAVGGPIPLGYYKDGEKSARTFRVVGAKRYSIPGDFATIEADGTITLLGRGSVCINTGGEKVFPEEVEEVLKEHPAVLDCNVVGVPDEQWGEAVTAVVALRQDGEATTDDLLDLARRRLAGYKRPKHVVIVEAILRGPAGKPDYRWARETAEQELAARRG